MSHPSILVTCWHPFGGAEVVTSEQPNKDWKKKPLPNLEYPCLPPLPLILLGLSGLFSTVHGFHVISRSIRRPLLLYNTLSNPPIPPPLLRPLLPFVLPLRHDSLPSKWPQRPSNPRHGMRCGPHQPLRRMKIPAEMISTKGRNRWWLRFVHLTSVISAVAICQIAQKRGSWGFLPALCVLATLCLCEPWVLVS